MHRRKHHHAPEKRRPVSQFEYDRRTDHVKRKAILNNVEIIQGLFSGLTIEASQGSLGDDSLGQFSEWDERHGLDFVIEPVDESHDSKMEKAKAVVYSLDHSQLSEIRTSSGEAALKLAQIVPIAQLNGYVAESQN